MIIYKQGDLMSVNEGIIVHGCNARGSMGSGVALAVRYKYAEAFKLYRKQYLAQGLNLGEVVWCWQDDVFIANAITQETYGRDSSVRYVNYVAIATCFKEIFKEALTHNLVVNFPKIGAGLANGDWSIIEQLINDADPSNEITKVCWVL